MSPAASFVAFLALTLAGLGGVFWTGLHGQRRRHIPLVVLTLTFLGMTIYYAERLGEGLDVSRAGRITPVHLTLAKITTLAYLAPVASGIATLRDPGWRMLHGKIAWTVLVLTVLTAVTGIWMVLASPPLTS
jgi:hypothetical protein